MIERIYGRYFIRSNPALIARVIEIKRQRQREGEVLR